MAGHTVDLTLDKPRSLRYDLNALADVETLLGKPFGVVVGEMRALGVVSLRALLWAGLRHEDRRLTVERAGALIQGYLEQDGNLLEQLYAKIDEALVKSKVFGTPEGNQSSPGAAGPIAG